MIVRIIKQNDVHEIPYEEEDLECLTKCPHGKKVSDLSVMVGSLACMECDCFKGYSEDKKSVLCNCKKKIKN